MSTGAIRLRQAASSTAVRARWRGSRTRARIRTAEIAASWTTLASHGDVASNGWKSGKKPVKNQDLWVALLAAIDPHTVKWKRVKGHSTVALNNRCDVVATHERDIHAG